MAWLEEETYAPVVDKAWLGLVDKLDENGEMEEVCVGTNEKTTAQEYLVRPRRTGDFHGQAPMLWAASALLQLENSRVNTRNNDLEKIRDEIVVYPNPAKDKVFFRSADMLESKPVFELLSENGSIINSDQISASSLEAGIPRVLRIFTLYFMHLLRIFTLFFQLF